MKRDQENVFHPIAQANKETNMTTFIDEKNLSKLAEHSKEKGLVLLSIPYKEKIPKIKKWQKSSIGQHNFKGQKSNVGLLLGEASGKLIDIDLDCSQALRAAPGILPDTVVFGRKSTPRSHYVYRVDQSIPRITFKDPKTKEMIVELRGDGCQTVIPPSTHPSGEGIEWVKSGDPLSIKIKDLERLVAKVAGISLLAKYWPSEGSRQNTALCLAGALLQNNFGPEETEQIIKKVCEIAGDDTEIEMRLGTVDSTRQQLSKSNKVKGVGGLHEIFGEEVSSALCKWLGLSSKKRAKPFEPIFISDGRYWSKNSRGATPISSFYIEAQEAIDTPDDGEYLKVKLVGGKVAVEKMLPPDIWSSQQKFLNALPTHYFTFTGTAKDIQNIRASFKYTDIPRKVGTKIAGFHEGVFVTEYGAVNLQGKVEDIVFIGTTGSNCKLTEYEPLGNEISQYRDTLIRFNAPEISYTLLGWITACFFKPIFMKHYDAFPLLNIEGQKESGKTSTLNNVLMRLFALECNPSNIGQVTRFTAMKGASASNCIPNIYDENKSARMDKRQNNIISELIRASYNGNEGERGHANLTVSRYKFDAPLVIAGESGFVEPALLDRFTFVHFSADVSKAYKKQFDALSGAPLEQIGRMLLNAALTYSEEDVLKLYKEEYEAISKDLTGRPLYNTAVVRTGLKVFCQVTGCAVPDPERIDHGMVRGLSDDNSVSSQRKSVVSRIIEAFGTMSGYTIKEINEASPAQQIYHFNERLERGVHYDVSTTELRIYLAAVYPIFQKWARNHEFEGDMLNKQTFIKQLKDEKYFIDRKNAQIGNSVRSAIILNLIDMEKEGLDIPSEWLR